MSSGWTVTQQLQLTQAIHRANGAIDWDQIARLLDHSPESCAQEFQRLSQGHPPNVPPVEHAVLSLRPALIQSIRDAIHADDALYKKLTDDIKQLEAALKEKDVVMEEAEVVTQKAQTMHPMASTRSSSSTTSSGPEEQSQAKWRKTVMLIYEEICNHKHGPVFLHAVKPETPYYYKAIKQPMDLAMIKARLRDGVIKTTTEFHRDLLLMCQNAIMFNKEGSPMHRYGIEMKRFVEQKMSAYRATEHLVKRNSIDMGSSSNNSSRKTSVSQ